jgi:hypothetical protein
MMVTVRAGPYTPVVFDTAAALTNAMRDIGHGLKWWWWFGLWLAAALALLAPACVVAGPAVSPVPEVAAPAVSETTAPVAAAEGDCAEFIPAGVAATLSTKGFWIILGLVVLGWVVLAADLPHEWL